MKNQVWSEGRRDVVKRMEYKLTEDGLDLESAGSEREKGA